MVEKNKNTHAEKFKRKFEIFQKTSKTFSGRVCKYMNAREWNADVFAHRTNLLERVYYRIKSDKMNNPLVETVLAISIGLQLTASERTELLALAGRVLQSTKQHFAYEYIFDNFSVKSVEEFNTIFLELNVETTAPLRESGK